MAHDFVLMVKLQDVNGELTSKRFELNGYLGVTIDLSWQSAFSDATDLLAALDNVTGCQIVGASLNAALENDNIFNSYKNAPVAGSDVTDLAKLTVAIVSNDTLKTAPMVIPSPVIGIFMGASGVSAHIVDITDANLLTYVQQFESQPGGGPNISDNETVDTDQGSGGILSAVWGSSKR